MYALLRVIIVLPIGTTEKYCIYSSGFFYIPIRFLVGRNETSCKVTGDHDFALDYYVESFLLGLNLSHHPNARIIKLFCNPKAKI
jgi:hypothetical protein